MEIVANEEIFVGIPSHSDYEVSNFGSVRSKDMVRVVPSKWGGVMNRKTKGRLLKSWMAGSGYLMVCLGVGNKYYVHRLVADAFCGGRDQSKQVNHKDGDKSNNSSSNLEWVTPRENMLHSTHVLNNRAGQFRVGGGRFD
jgi:hypothetical protein